MSFQTSTKPFNTAILVKGVRNYIQVNANHSEEKKRCKLWHPSGVFYTYVFGFGRMRFPRQPHASDSKDACR
ncbi:hypothetical protein L596_012964 [Steinernema carpocapsae]|uniref:Uncharacterized protein n=1 Tax=Steinernema carpocapsae TaxID=34508 RepID=A0A4V6A500_STECR|nr:hypothetical protein L596_012964 [Steinernema carpocapsae]